MNTLTPTPPPEFLSEYLPSRVAAQEVRALVLDALARRGWSGTEFDAACVERTRGTTRPLVTGTASRMLRRFASQRSCDVNVADLMLTVCGEHLANLDSFTEQADGALDEWDAQRT